MDVVEVTWGAVAGATSYHARLVDSVTQFPNPSEGVLPMVCEGAAFPATYCASTVPATQLKDTFFVRLKNGWRRVAIAAAWAVDASGFSSSVRTGSMGLSRCNDVALDSVLPCPVTPTLITMPTAPAVRDTIRVPFAWDAGRWQTGYRLWVSASATSTTWSGLPVAFDTVGRGYVLRAVPQAEWDSVTFTIVVRSVRGLLVSRDSAVTTWVVRRWPVAPTTITVDSSAVIISLRVEPFAYTVGQTQPILRFCAFPVFSDGVIATGGDPRCDSLYVANIPLPVRQLVTSWHRAAAETTTVVWSVVGGGILTNP
jgi:hypothetical protein